MVNENGPEPFSLNEEAAWIWLINTVFEYESGVDTGLDTGERPPIGVAWHPREVGEEDTTFLLIRGAQEGDVLTAPPGVELDFEFIDDGDGGYYRYLLCIHEPAPLITASDAEEMRRLGERDATGIDAALAILREAVDAGNSTYRQLSTFVAATSVSG